MERKDAKFTPAPGQHNITSRISDGPKWGIGQKLSNDFSKTQNVPGPGNYELQNRDNLNMKSAQRYSVGHSKRGGLAEKGNLNVPGPGNYTTNMSTSASSPRYGFGSSKRGKAGRTSAAPGPGNYAIPSIVGAEGLKMSMHAKLRSSIESNTLSPGPGAYESNLSNKKKDPQYGLGTSKRPDLGVKTLSPGSAAYNPNATFTHKKNAEWRFGTDSRKGLAMKSLSPGPGNYSIESLDFNTSKSKFYVGSKLPALKATTDVPGAGTYNPEPEKLKKKLPAFSMAMRLGSSLT